MGGIFSFVQNGSWSDAVKINLEVGVSEIYVPPSTEVRTGTVESVILIRFTRTLGFYGHPPQRITSSTTKFSMGLASRPEGSVLHVATFGEWSCIEGGARITIDSIDAPSGITVTTAIDHAGDGSVAKGTDYHTSGSGYWYASRVPAFGWKRVDDPKSSSGCC